MTSLFRFITRIGRGFRAGDSVSSQRTVYPDPMSLIITLDDGHDNQRTIAFEGTVNFRDIGGYRTSDGYAVRWGRVYRSGGLSRLTDHDLDRLRELGIRLVFDLRSVEETNGEPDRLPFNPTPQYRHLPLQAEMGRSAQLRALFSDRARLATMLPELYIQLVDKNAPVFAQVLRHVAEADNQPALIHCTAGKDRTGITVALLLTVLGVPEATILADYSQSTRHWEYYRDVTGPLIRRFRVFGVRIEDLQPLFTADPAYMRTLLTHLRERYGSVEAYLRDAGGLETAALARLRSTLLD